MEEKCYFNKAWVIISSSQDSSYPTTNPFFPHILIFIYSFANTWTPDDWLQEYDCAGFPSSADDCDNNYLSPNYIIVAFLRVMTKTL